MSVTDKVMDTKQVEEEIAEFNELRWLIDTREQAQKTRIASENRLRALQREDDEGPEARFLSELVEKFSAIETQIERRIRNTVKTHPAWPWLAKVKGMGPTLSARMLGLIPNIDSFTTVSKLWRYAGLAVIDGKAERPVKGEKLRYNKRLKSTMYLIAGSMLKSNSPYRLVYDRAKEYYEQARPDWTKGHIHMASLRKMEKVFLSHLWLVWREAEGLDTRPLYVHEYLKHEMEYKVEDFIS